MHTVPSNQFPPLVSRRSTSRLPFAFTPLHLLLPLSLTIFGCIRLSFNSLSPSCDALYAISYPFTPPRPAPLCQPVSNCVFPLHLAISLVSFLLCLPFIPCFFPRTITFMCDYIFSSLCPCFSYPAPLSCTFHLSLYLCKVGLNPYQLISP